MDNKLYRSRCVPGTGRETMKVINGVELQRAFVYLPAPVWDKLRNLGICHNTSDSIIIEQLIEIASATH